MPITKSAKKALRKNVKRRARNMLYKKKTRGLLKQARNLVSQKKGAEAIKLLPQIYKALDKAAKKGALKKNTVSRKKSRISRLVGKSAKETKSG